MQISRSHINNLDTLEAYLLSFVRMTPITFPTNLSRLCTPSGASPKPYPPQTKLVKDVIVSSPVCCQPVSTLSAGSPCGCSRLGRLVFGTPSLSVRELRTPFNPLSVPLPTHFAVRNRPQRTTTEQRLEQYSIAHGQYLVEDLGLFLAFLMHACRSGPSSYMGVSRAPPLA